MDHRLMVRRGVLITLSVLTVLFIGLAWRAAFPVDVAKSSKTGAVGVISPRRVPTLLAGVANDKMVRERVSQALRGVNVSCIAVYDSGRPVVIKNATTPFVPASTLKLLTAVGALDALGPDATFSTTISSASKPKNGVIEGPLFFVGGGDPLLATNDYIAAMKDRVAAYTSLESLVDQLVQAGIHEVKGGVVIDDSIFDAQRSIPSWDPGYAQFGTVGPIGALMVNQGFARFDQTKMPVADPGLHAGDALRVLLSAKGIAVRGSTTRGSAPEKTQVLGSIASHPVRELVKAMLTESDNTMAEVLLKNISAKKSRPATVTAGVAAVLESLRSRGFSVEGVAMTDGSGLDRSDRSTCLATAEVLLDDGPGGVLSRGLARAGESGTLRDRMRGTAAVGRVEAKTGTLTDVSGLAGWVHPDGVDSIAFATLSNGTNSAISRAAEDRLAIALATLPPSPSPIVYAP